MSQLTEMTLDIFRDFAVEAANERGSVDNCGMFLVVCQNRRIFIAIEVFGLTGLNDMGSVAFNAAQKSGLSDMFIAFFLRYARSSSEELSNPELGLEVSEDSGVGYSESGLLDRTNSRPALAITAIEGKSATTEVRSVYKEIGEIKLGKPLKDKFRMKLSEESVRLITCDAVRDFENNVAETIRDLKDVHPTDVDHETEILVREQARWYWTARYLLEDLGSAGVRVNAYYPSMSQLQRQLELSRP